MTRGAVYWHFADKAELFNAMMARTTLPMEDTIEAIDRADQTAPLADLRRVVLVNRRSLLALRLRLQQRNLLCELPIFLAV